MMNDDQLEFLPNNEPIDETVKKDTLKCGIHRWALQEDFIEYKFGGKTQLKCRYCIHVILENKKIQHAFWKKQKEELTDYYIRRIFVNRGAGMKMDDYPQELVDAKRAVEQLKREEKKQKGVYLKCKKHGNCYKKDVIKKGISHRTGKQFYRCKHCMKEIHHKNYQLNKIAIHIKTQEWRKNNRERKRKMDKEWRDKNRDRLIVREREKNKKYRENNRERLSERQKVRRNVEVVELKDTYIKKLLADSSIHLSRKDIPQDMIDLKKILVQIKRITKRK